MAGGVRNMKYVTMKKERKGIENAENDVDRSDCRIVNHFGFGSVLWPRLGHVGKGGGMSPAAFQYWYGKTPEQAIYDDPYLHSNRAMRQRSEHQNPSGVRWAQAILQSAREESHASWRH